jgi:CheY-like chemotaxis protein
MTTMSEETPGRTAVIADRHALGRNLVRFLLEEEGFEISAEAATIAEVLLAIQHQAPDVLVVHENLTHDHDLAVFAQIRQLSPNTNLVLMTGNRDDLAVELIFIADAVVEEGPGLGQLVFAAAWQAPTEAQRAEAELRAARARRAARRGWRPPWGERLDTRGAVAASIIVMAVMLIRAAGFAPFVGSDAPESPAPSIRAEGPGAGAATASAPRFELASYTSPAAEVRATGSSHGPGPTPDPDEGPAPNPGAEPGPDPTEEPPPGPSEQPPDHPAPDGSDPQGSVIDDVTAPVEDVVDGVVGTTDDVIDQVEVVVDDVQGAVEDVVDDAQVVVEDVVDDVDVVVDDVDDVVGGVVGGLSTPPLG